MTFSTEPRASRPARSDRRGSVLVGLVSVAGGVTALLAEASPTGVPIADGVYRALYAVLVAAACAGSRRWTWPIVGGSALVAGHSGPWAVCAAVALGGAFAAQFPVRREPVVGALVGALAAQSLLRLPELGAFGVPSLIAALAPLPAAVSALRLTSRARPKAAVAGVAVATIAALTLAVFVTGMLVLRADATAGVQDARAAVGALRGGDQHTATRHFDAAAGSFARANDRAHSWWLRPLRVVPGLAQHLVAARTVTEVGRDLAELSAESAPAVTADRLTTPEGRFRLDRIAALQPVAERGVAALERSGAELAALSSDWLSPPLTSAVDDLRHEIAEAVPTARTTAEILERSPTLLGAEGPRTYAVLFGNPAEARELGGFVGSVGVLVADDGELEFEALSTPANLSSRLRLAGAQLTVPVPPSVAAAQPEDHVENWSDSPEMATVNAVAAALFPAATGGRSIDGVVYVDPYVLATMLELSGPVRIPDVDIELTAANAVDYFLRDQYQAEGFEPGDERKERLGAAGEVAFARLFSGSLPEPRRLADVLGPLVRGRRLLFSTTDPETNLLLTDLGLLPSVRDDASETVLVTHGNRRANKLDAYLERNISYAARVRPNGSTAASLTVELVNTAPATGLAEHQLSWVRLNDQTPRTSNVLTLSAYSGMTLESVTIDGGPTGSARAAAYGLHQYSVPVTVPAGATVRVEFELSGTVDPDSCSFTFRPNAVAADDTIRASIESPDGTRSLSRRALVRTENVPCSP